MSFKNDENCLLFHLKSSICPPDIHVFASTIWSCMKSDLIREIRLISNLCHNARNKQLIKILILPDISQSKGSHVMKFGHLIQCNKRIT